MPPRSKILSLPTDLQEALNARLVGTGFQNYQALATWLNRELEQRGLTLRVSAMSIHRHGEKFEEKLADLRLATEQAKALVQGAADDEGAINDAVLRLTQERLFTLLKEMDRIDPDKVNIAQLLRGIAQVSNATVPQKKWMVEVREKAKAAVKAIKKTAVKGGLSQAAIKEIEEQVLGIVR